MRVAARISIFVDNNASRCYRSEAETIVASDRLFRADENRAHHSPFFTVPRGTRFLDVRSDDSPIPA